MGDKPDTAGHVVCSMPHSGTRTLQTHLSETRPQILRPGQDQIGHWHFTLHPLYIKKFLELGGDRRAYIPVRNLFDVCDSWERRYGRAVDKTAKDMSEGIQLMVDCVDRHSDCIEIFKMEDLPVLRGMGPPRPEGWDRETWVKSDRMKWMRDWVRRESSVESFYRTYYTAEELWWL